MNYFFSSVIFVVGEKELYFCFQILTLMFFFIDEITSSPSWGLKFFGGWFPEFFGGWFPKLFRSELRDARVGERFVDDFGQCCPNPVSMCLAV